MKIQLNKMLSKVFKYAKYFVMFVFVPAVLVSGIIVTIVILCYLADCKTISSRYQLIIGLATSLFSTVLAASSLITLLINQAKTNAHAAEATISLVNNFNDNYLEDLVFIRHSIKNANQTKSYKPHKTPLIDETKYPAAPLPNGITFADYKAEITKYSFYDLYGKSGTISSSLGQFLSNNLNFSVNNVATQTVYSIFKQKRIRILNFFESMAIGIGNKVTHGSLLKIQFSDLLSKTIPLLLIFIYNEEGEECYPALRAMLMEWFSKEKK